MPWWGADSRWISLRLKLKRKLRGDISGEFAFDTTVTVLQGIPSLINWFRSPGSGEVEAAFVKCELDDLEGQSLRLRERYQDAAPAEEPE